MARKRSATNENQRLWERFDALERKFILFLVHAAAPISLDALISLGASSAVQAINIMEKLKELGVVLEKREKGVYSMGDGGFPGFVRQQVQDDEEREVLEQIVAYYLASHEESDDNILLLADLYFRLGDPRAGIRHVRKAAHLLYRSNRKEQAEAYQDFLLEGFLETGVTVETAADFIDTVLDKIRLTVSSLPSREAISLLERALGTAVEYRMPDRLVRVKTALIYKLQASGEFDAADRHMESLSDLAAKVEEPRLRVSTALAMSDILSRRGRLKEAIDSYEAIGGELDQWIQDESDLIAVATIANKYVLRGKIQQGGDILDRVQAKAEALNYPNVLTHVEMMRLYNWLELRKPDQIRSVLDRIYSLLEKGPADPHSAVGTNFAEAYLCYVQGDYARVMSYHNRGVASAREAGIGTLLWGWGFEYLNGVRHAGILEEEVSIDREIEGLLAANHIYRRGVALKHRALLNMERSAPAGAVLADLDESRACLEEAGADIEIARVMLALGKLYSRKGDEKRAKESFDRVFSFLATLDHALFPEDLLAMMPMDARAAVLADRVVRIQGEAESLQETGRYLDRMLRAVMEFSRAVRGVFLSVDGNRFRILANRDFSPDLLVLERYAGCQTAILEAATEGRELVVPCGVRRIDEAFSRAGISSLLGSPVAGEEGAAGYLLLGGCSAGVNEPCDRLYPFIRLICSQAAVGAMLINARERSDRLQRQLRRRSEPVPEEAASSLSFSMIVGRSKAVTRVKDQVQQVAGTDSTVLILGETGVGKELVAKAIHQLSPRAAGPFIPVNIAALPQELAASELFGHERGAFTGAHLQNKGRFELANGGTIFLDEVGELSIPLQVKLLRVLQEGVFERLGSSKPIHSDFRVITATNKDLVSEVSRGGFREDLYYRLNVFPVNIPPLRLRRGDIPLLAKHFVDFYSEKMGRSLSISPAQLKRLEAYHWPGNVRELKHFIEKAVILSEDGELTLSCPEEVWSGGQDGGNNRRLGSMVHIEKAHIEEVLRATMGRVKGPGGAAAVLEMKPSTLYYRMKKLGIQR